MKKYIKSDTNLYTVNEVSCNDPEAVMRDILTTLGFTYIKDYTDDDLFIGVHGNDVIIYNGVYHGTFVRYKNTVEMVDMFMDYYLSEMPDDKSQDFENLVINNEFESTSDLYDMLRWLMW